MKFIQDICLLSLFLGGVFSQSSLISGIDNLNSNWTYAQTNITVEFMIYSSEGQFIVISDQAIYNNYSLNETGLSSVCMYFVMRVYTTNLSEPENDTHLEIYANNQLSGKTGIQSCETAYSNEYGIATENVKFTQMVCQFPMIPVNNGKLELLVSPKEFKDPSKHFFAISSPTFYSECSEDILYDLLNPREVTYFQDYLDNMVFSFFFCIILVIASSICGAYILEKHFDFTETLTDEHKSASNEKQAKDTDKIKTDVVMELTTMDTVPKADQ